MFVSVAKLRKEINELKKTKGSDSVPFEILDKYINEEITYNKALNLLDTENPPFADMQRVIIKSSNPAIVKEELDKVHGDYLKGIFRELKEEQENKK